MHFAAKLIKLLPIQSGLSIKGPWSKQNIIVETTDEYSKKVCISIWNGRVDISKLEVGKEYNFHSNIESKEYKGKWYTEVTLWKIDEKKGVSLNDFLKTTQSYQYQPLELNEEGFPDFDPLADYEEQEPDWDKVISSGTAADLPGSLKKLCKIENPDTSSSKTGDIDEHEPDWENIIISGNSSNLPDRSEIAAGVADLISQEIPSEENSGSDNDSNSNQDLSKTPFQGILKINPEKIKKLKLSRKITDYKKEVDESNEPDYSL